MSSSDGAHEISEDTDNSTFSAVTVHEDTVGLIDDLKPEYMSKSAFAEGVIWMFFGHLSPKNTRRLTLNEHQAIRQLKRCGIDHQVIGAAFDIQPEYVRHVQSEHGQGERLPLDEREDEGE